MIGRSSVLQREARAAAEAGAKYLCGQQSPEGVWPDFQVAQGPSTSWTTALVAVNVRPFPFARGAVTAARQFLRVTHRPSEGWGYNESVRYCDADATAWAILALEPGKGRQALHTELLAYRRPGGLIATFSEPSAGSGWCSPHPDVTAVSLWALAATGGDPKLVFESTKALVQAGLRHEWRPYWWRDPSYTNAHAFRAFNAVAKHYPQVFAAIAPDIGRLAVRNVTAYAGLGAFGIALRLTTAMLAGASQRHPDSLADQLLSLRVGAAWSPSAELSVRSREDSTPCSERDVVVLDNHGLITAAFATDALRRYAAR